MGLPDPGMELSDPGLELSFPGLEPSDPGLEPPLYELSLVFTRKIYSLDRIRRQKAWLNLSLDHGENLGSF
jgi:hypothetical protein